MRKITFLFLIIFKVESSFIPNFEQPECTMLNDDITKKQKVIGVIGGASWESTLSYYQEINEKVRDHLGGGLNSAKLIIYSLNYAPIVALEEQENWSEIGCQLGSIAKILEGAGADFVVLSCNTLHKVAADIEASISIPFCHIATSAGKKLVSAGIRKIGLLGTQFTMEDGFYASKLKEDFNLEVVTPCLRSRQIVDKIIYSELCLGKTSPQSKSELVRIINELQGEGVEAVLLGCTELGILIKQEDSQIPIFDTTLLHIQDIVKFSLP